MRGVNWRSAWRALEHCDAWWLVPAMVAFAAQTVMRAMRWRSLFAHARRPPRGPVLAATMIGYLFNNIMPARAGEVARVVALTQRTGTPAAEIVGTAIVERAYDVLSILIIFFCASPWLPHESWFATAAILAGVAAVGARRRDLGARRPRRPPAARARAPARPAAAALAERVEREAATLAEGLSGLREHRVALEALRVEPRRLDDRGALGLAGAARVRAHVRLRRRRARDVRDRPLDDHPVAAGGGRRVRGRRRARARTPTASRSRQALPYALVLHVSNFVPLVVVGALTLHRRGRARPAQGRGGPRDLYLTVPGPGSARVQEMVIYGVSFDMVGKQPIVLLKTADGNKFLPIWIGHPEAASILMKLQGATTPRPMTHDLLCDVLGELDVRCTQVAVTELRDNTFFAQITLQVAGRELEIDSRPSDAIALAVRVGAPIFAAEEVIADSAIEFEHEVEDTDDVVEKFKEFLDQVTPEDFAGES